MIRLGRLFLLLMLFAATFGAIEPAVASVHAEPAGATHLALPCHSEPPSHTHLPGFHVCCGSNVAAPATVELPSQLQPVASSERVVATIARLAGLTLAPRSPPPRA